MMQIGVISNWFPTKSGGAFLELNGVKYVLGREQMQPGLDKNVGVRLTPGGDWQPDQRSGKMIQKVANIAVDPNATAQGYQQSPQTPAQQPISQKGYPDLPPIFSNVLGHLAGAAPERPDLVETWFGAVHAAMVRDRRKTIQTQPTEPGEAFDESIPF